MRNTMRKGSIANDGRWTLQWQETTKEVRQETRDGMTDNVVAAVQEFFQMTKQQKTHSQLTSDVNDTVVDNKLMTDDKCKQCQMNSVKASDDELKVNKKLVVDEQKWCCSAAGIFFGFFDTKVANVTMKRICEEHWYLSTP